MTGRGVHRFGTRVLSGMMAVIGVAMIVEAIADQRAGDVSLLLVLGVLFVAAGTGRLYAERRRGSG
jgi:hypothetical protein